MQQFGRRSNGNSQNNVQQYGNDNSNAQASIQQYGRKNSLSGLGQSQGMSGQRQGSQVQQFGRRNSNVQAEIQQYSGAGPSSELLGESLIQPSSGILEHL